MRYSAVQAQEVVRAVVKKEKSEVDYMPVAAMKSERCDRCKHFRELYDTCDLVKGKVKPNAWCDLFSRK